MEKKKMTTLFSNMFKAFFFDHLVGAPAQHFTYIVIVAAQIKQAIRAGRIMNLSEKK
jgi:hypothetical protein